MAQPIKDAQTVQRVMFNRVIAPTQCGQCGTPVLSFTTRQPMLASFSDGESQSSGSITIQPFVDARIRTAAAELETYGIPHEQGPYADRQGLVARLSREISAGSGDREEIIPRLRDILRPYIGMEAEAMFPRQHFSEQFNFIHNEQYANVPDELPFAGAILTQQERCTLNDETGAASIILTHVMEPYILATAVLRNAGIAAYPALATFVSGNTEMMTPLLSILDLTSDDTPLTTFALTAQHPNLASLILISDTAMTGVMNAIVAETRAKHLCVELVEHSKAGSDMPPEMMDNQLKRIANALFAAHTLWTGSHFISEALEFMRSQITEALNFITLDATAKSLSIETGVPYDVFVSILLQSSSDPEPAVAMNTASMAFSGYTQQTGYNGPDVDLGAALLKICQKAVAGAGQFVDTTLGYLTNCISSGKPLPTFEGNRAQP